ncbi:hypothetical protein MTO96_032366 [Rhipicephalus appendiculatus]
MFFYYYLHSAAFPLKPAKWFQCRIKRVTAVLLLVIFAYVAIQSITPRSNKFVPDRSLRWFPEVITNDLYMERRYNKPNKYIINPQNVCPPNVLVDYLFVVFSAAEHAESRRVIRDTWVKDARRSSGNRVIFIFGKPARFVIKIDDDSLPNLANLYRAMHGQPEDAIYGELKRAYVPERSANHKWYIPYEEYPRNVVPDFIMGGMYVIGGRVVDLLYRVTGHVKPFRMEDMFLTGMCAERARVTRTHLAGTYIEKLSSPCDYKKSIYGHHVSASEMKDVWYAMKRIEYKCIRLFFSFHFCHCIYKQNMPAVEIETPMF